MTQLALAFAPEEHFQAQEFFLSASNEEAYHLVTGWPQGWRSKQAMIVGPTASGKSHLLSIWAEQSDAITLTPSNIASLTREAASTPPACAAMLDDAQLLAGHAELEQELFHFLNQWQMVGGWLLLSANASPQHWGIKLPDLQSRLMAMQGCYLREPDDLLLSQLIVKHAYDYGCILKPNLVEYLSRHMPRSFAASRQIIRELNHMSLQQKKPIGLQMVKQALEAFI